MSHPSLLSGHCAGPLARHLAACMLALLVSLQGITAGVVTTLGPAHAHRASAAVLVLEDVRRSRPPATSPQTHVAGALGHFHGADSAQRHRHDRRDASVVPTDAGSAPAENFEELGVSPTLAMFVALMTTPPVWLESALGEAPARGAEWHALANHPKPPKRPPRGV